MSQGRRHRRRRRRRRRSRSHNPISQLLTSAVAMAVGSGNLVAARVALRTSATAAAAGLRASVILVNPRQLFRAYGTPPAAGSRASETLVILRQLSHPSGAAAGAAAGRSSGAAGVAAATGAARRSVKISSRAPSAEEAGVSHYTRHAIHIIGSCRFVSETKSCDVASIFHMALEEGTTGGGMNGGGGMTGGSMSSGGGTTVDEGMTGGGVTGGGVSGGGMTCGSMTGGGMTGGGMSANGGSGAALPEAGTSECCSPRHPRWCACTFECVPVHYELTVPSRQPTSLQGGHVLELELRRGLILAVHGYLSARHVATADGRCG